MKRGQKQGFAGLFGLESLFFERMILDEAHLIKNFETSTSRSVTELSAKCKYRWCLTGTPIHNSITDLFALFKYMHIPQGQNMRFFKDFFKMAASKNNNNNSSSSSNGNILGSLNGNRSNSNNNNNNGNNNKLPMTDETRVVLLEFLPKVMLRRTKLEVLKKFAEKKELRIDVKLTPAERMIYEEFEVKAKQEFREMLKKTGKKRKRGMKLAVLYTLILRMRQACLHPYLVLNTEENKSSTSLYGSNQDPLAGVDKNVISRLNQSESIPDGVECVFFFLFVCVVVGIVASALSLSLLWISSALRVL